MILKQTAKEYFRPWQRIRKFFLRKVRNNITLQFYYLKLARFLCTRGITPPLSKSTEEQELRWYNHRNPLTSRWPKRPETYVKLDDTVVKMFQEILPQLGKDSSILEIGCNAGRSLNYLHEKGFHNLTGIEIGPKAVELFEQKFPKTYNNANIILGNAVNEIRKFENDVFDLVFTNSVLVNIGAKHNQFFKEICRVCRKHILTYESEGSWTVFPRDLQAMFERNSFSMVLFKRMMTANTEREFVLKYPDRMTPETDLRSGTIRLFVSR